MVEFGNNSDFILKRNKTQFISLLFIGNYSFDVLQMLGIWKHLTRDIRPNANAFSTSASFKAFFIQKYPSST